MAVVIRLARHGQAGRPSYRIVATEKQSRRDGRFIEIIGFYNPKAQPPLLSMKEDRIRLWVSNGAKPSSTVATLIKKNIPGLLEDRESHQKGKIIEQRRKRKAKAGKQDSAPQAKSSAKKAPAKPKAAKKKGNRSRLRKEAFSPPL